MTSLNIAILGSTNGSILPQICHAIEQKRFKSHIKVVISNNKHAQILVKATKCQIPAVYLDSGTLTRAEFDQLITEELKKYHIDLILLIGYMKILSSEFVKQWSPNIINVHPSLLPKYKGLMNLAVHQAVIDAKEQETGCSVHYVTEAVDEGEVIIQKKCAVGEVDTPESLKLRVQQLEAMAMIEAILIKEKNL